MDGLRATTCVPCLEHRLKQVAQLPIDKTFSIFELVQIMKPWNDEQWVVLCPDCGALSLHSWFGDRIDWNCLDPIGTEWI